MSVQVSEDVRKIQELLAKEDHQAIYSQYAPVLQEMLFVQSQEEWLDFIRQEGALEEEPLKLYLSAWRGESLLLGCYEGEATQKVLDYLKGRIPDDLLERLNGLAPVVIDIDELNGRLEKQIAPYREILDPIGFILHIGFEDIYCDGAYFLSVGVR